MSLITIFLKHISNLLIDYIKRVFSFNNVPKVSSLAFSSISIIMLGQNWKIIKAVYIIE